MDDPEAFGRRDAEFARRLGEHDRSVVADIVRAYGPRLGRYLRRFLGPNFGLEDLDDVAQEALAETWTDYRPGAGSRVLSFLLKVGYRRAIDRMRRRRTEKKGWAKLAPEDLDPAVPARHTEIDDDVMLAYATVQPHLAQAVATLTDRQRLAFERRFAAGDGEAWALQLQRETGQPARQWRKASDEAKQAVIAYLQQLGLELNIHEGGRYETRQAKSSS